MLGPVRTRFLLIPGNVWLLVLTTLNINKPNAIVKAIIKNGRTPMTDVKKSFCPIFLMRAADVCELPSDVSSTFTSIDAAAPPSISSGDILRGFFFVFLCTEGAFGARRRNACSSPVNSAGSRVKERESNGDSDTSFIIFLRCGANNGSHQRYLFDR